MAWYDTDWEYRIKLTIDHNDVDVDLADFPVSVFLNSSRVDWSHVQDDLDDIRFTSNDTETLLKFEIENYTVNNEAWLWVKVPVIASSVDTDFYMYYGNTGASSGEDATNVWDANFLMVQHLSDNTTSSTLDSTSNGNDGTKEGAGTPYEVAGKMGRAQNLTGDYIDCQSILNASVGTISLWMKPFTITGLNRPAENNGYLFFKWEEGTTDFVFIIYDGATKTSPSFDINQTDAWHHVVGTWDSSNLKLYVNGSYIGQTACGAVGSVAEDFEIGSHYVAPNDFDGGIIDEVRVSEVARNESWIKACYESESDDYLTFGSEEEQWLSGWRNRVKVTIDCNDVDADLTHFPVMIYLSTDSGRGSDDVTYIFDHLGSNSKKIAVTKNDGTTQLYVEIEKWDATAEEAVLWVSKSDWTIASGSDTEFYIYYDSTQSDNDAYVGVKESTPAKNVWDSNFKGVWHCDEAPSGANDTKDSTSNKRNLTAYHMESEDSISAKIGKGLIMDGGGGEYIGHHYTCPFNDVGYYTIEFWFKPDSTETQGTLYSLAQHGALRTADDEGIWELDILGDYIDNGTRVQNAGNACLYGDNQTALIDTWTHWVSHHDGGNNLWKTYSNGTIDINSAYTKDLTTADLYLKIGVMADSGFPFKGVVDEIRISDNRSAAWVKATYESGDDDFIDFGSFSPAYSVSLHTVDNDTNTLTETVVSMNNGTAYTKTVDSEGWANWTHINALTVNVSATWYGVTVNSTFTITMDSNKTVDVKCLVYLFNDDTQKVASNASVTSVGYASSVLTVRFSDSVDTYQMVSTGSSPTYVTNATYNLDVDYTTVLNVTHYANATLQVSWESWGDTYIKQSTDRLVSVDLTGNKLRMYVNDSAGSGTLKIYCGSRGNPQTDLGFTATSYNATSTVFTGTINFTSQVYCWVDWTTGTGPHPGNGNGGPGAPTSQLVVTIPRQRLTVTTGKPTSGNLSFTFDRSSLIYLEDVTFEKEWFTIQETLPLRISKADEGDKTVNLPLTIYVPADTPLALYEISCTLEISDGLVDHEIMGLLEFTVVAPISVPDIMPFIFIGVIALFLAGTFVLKKRK